MQIPNTVLILGALSLIILLVVIVIFVINSRRFNLTKPDSPNEKPEWMSSMPPKETVEATLADGEGIALYDYDEGEKLAAPFAEQIEDIVNVLIKDNPELSSLSVDFGTSDAGNLEIWLNETKYDQIDDIPNEALRDVLKEAIKRWEQHEA